MRALVLAALLAPAVAAADPSPLIHLDGGPEIEGGSTVTSTTFRGQGLLGMTFGGGRIRPELAAGGTLASGELFADDPRAVDGAVGLSMTSYGPEVQLGFSLYRDDAPTTRVFASLAYLYVDLDKRLMVDPIPGVGGDRGQRASLGINFARAELRHMDCYSRSSCDNFLLLLLPQQAELTRETDAGSTRYGITLSWGS